MKLDNKLYDRLKLVALVILPALATFYETISQIWGLPYGEAIVATCAALTLCVGSILQNSSSHYYLGMYQTSEENYVNTAAELNDLREELYSDEEDEE